MPAKSRTLGYAALAVGLFLSTAPAFAAGEGAEAPSSSSSTAAPPAHPTPAARRYVRRHTTAPAASSAAVTVPPGTTAAGTPTTGNGLAPVPGVAQTNSPAGGAGK